MRRTVRRVVAWGVGFGLAAVFGVAGAAGAVEEPNAFFLPAQGTVGQELRLIGTGFDGDTPVQVATDPDDEPTTVGHTNSEGAFDVPFTIPNVAPGHHVVLIWVGAIQWTAEYEVVASDPDPAPGPGASDGAVWFEPPAGTVGQQLQLIGLDFPADTDVLVTTTASPDPILVGKSASDGTFTLPFTIPDLSPGQHQVDVRVGGQTGELNLLVLPAGEPLPGNDGSGVHLSPDSASVGETITIFAAGVPPFQELCLLVKADPVVQACLGQTGATGDLFTSWKVPDIRPGTHQVLFVAGQVWDSTELTIVAAGTPSPSDSPLPVSATPTPVPAPTLTPTPAPRLAASGTPDVGALVPWGVAALAAAAALGVARLRSRTKE